MRHETVLRCIVGILVLDKAPTTSDSMIAGCIEGQNSVGKALVGARMGALPHGDLRRADGFVVGEQVATGRDGREHLGQTGSVGEVSVGRV